MYDELINNIDKIGYITIYPWKDNPTKMLVGCVLYHNPNWLAIWLIGPTGEEDGVFLCSWSQIFRVEFESRYSIQLIPDYLEERSQKICFSEDRIISLALENHSQVTIMLKDGDSEINGMIEEVSSDSFMLRTDNGEKDRDLLECRVNDGNLAYIWLEVPISEI